MANAEFIVTLRVTLPLVEGDSWLDPHSWAWQSAVTSSITGRSGTQVEILNLSPTKFEDEEDKERFSIHSREARERWEEERRGN